MIFNQYERLTGVFINPESSGMKALQHHTSVAWTKLSMTCVTNSKFSLLRLLSFHRANEAGGIDLRSAPLNTLKKPDSGTKLNRVLGTASGGTGNIMESVNLATGMLPKPSHGIREHH